MLVDQRPLQSDRLEDLCTAVGLNGGDPHLRNGLEQALADRLDDVRLGLVDRQLDGQQRALGQLVERFEHQVGVDRRRAVADQRRHVMDVAGLAGLNDQTCPQPGAAPHEVVMDGANREQRGDRHPLRPEVAV